MSAGPPEAALPPPVEQHPVAHRSPTLPARVVRAWQHANRISAAHPLAVFIASFVVGQALLALLLWWLLLWWLHLPAWLGLGGWIANGLVAWLIFGLGHTQATRRQTKERKHGDAVV